jgi:3-deoxy-manno-octulosonate cytidylyltransferase (CMP-KDO synthetase)
VVSYAVIIPARYQSSRLPGKPLINILGVPMVVRTYQQCIQACPQEKVYVATDDERIRETCEYYGMQVLMTSPACLTGTDRVAECAEQLDAEVFLNVQGDEPVFNPQDLTLLIESIDQFPGEILNGFCPLEEESLFRSGNTPKVVLRPDNYLLYMSRGPIPTTKKLGFVRAWRQVCAYAFPREALKAFSEFPEKTPLESLEDIEILRFLELGFNVKMLKMSNVSIPVDNPSDINLVEEFLKSSGLI